MPSQRGRGSGRRSRGTLYDILVAAPFWVCPLLALGAGIAVNAGCQQLLHMHSPAALQLALGAALIVLITGQVALPEKGRRAHHLRRTRTLDDLRALRWRDFEALVADMYRIYGWSVTETGARGIGGGDGGVDLLLRRSGEVVAVQCKRWKLRTVGVDKARELGGARADCGAQRAVLVSCGQFTAEAVAYARRNRMQLVDGTELLSMLPGSTPVARREAFTHLMSCPHCHAEMVRRKGRYGLFWGCSNYPTCRGTRRLEAMV